ncbi:PQQ-binding-like beta-propeller repeat protein [Streptomyces sp. CHD11]|uniref:PQQ-binding-like beta-propeller repeat protein n=1 Tax=Streptomyces sp. CHD11 TaxID=2741325 RepID=UPI001BFC116C|nr:PQQ-binding-like beta-propeller repeat protein [Streptomyces sp. CHD11]MBT3154242.1 PQQ-binding-like beta-propeller repeat protein [Streptomyces sp. CHD11]
MSDSKSDGGSFRSPGTPRTTSRRRLLRLAGGGLALAALTAGTVGCDDEAADTKDPASSGGTTPDGGDKGGSGGGGADKKGGAPKPLWTETTSAETFGDNDELVVAGGVVIASGTPLDALDAGTGKQKWSLPGGVVPGAPLLLSEDTLYLAGSQYDGSVTGYDPASGKETWRSRLGKGYRQPRPIAVDETQVYVIAEILEDDGSSTTNVIAALDSTTGRIAWKEQRDVGTMQSGIHAAVRGRRLVYTDFKKNLTVRDTATGRQVWTHKTTKTNYGFFAVHQDLVIVPQGQRLQAFTLSDGKEKWSLETADLTLFKEPAVVEDVLYIADSARTVRAVDPVTGKELWQSKALADAGLQVPRQYVKAGDTLYGATDLDPKGGIIAMDAKTGAVRWTFNDGTGDHHAWLVATDGKHVFALHGNKLHALPV